MRLPTLEEAVDEIGIPFPRDRKLECPKHEDKTGSLHLYEDSFYCFSCGATGDGIGLVALFTNQDVRRLLAQRGEGRSYRMATKGMSKTDVARSVQAGRRDLEHWWFDRIAEAYKDSQLWALERAIDMWSQVFDDLARRLSGKELFDGEEKPSAYVAEQQIAALRKQLETVLPLEVAEGERTRER